MLGIGFAATRDLNSFFRYEKKDDARHAESGGGRGALGDLRGQLAVGHVPARVHPASASTRTRPDASSGRAAIRTSRRACIDMNRRFALPGGAVRLYELGTEAPVWWEDWNDAPRGRGNIRTARSLPRHQHLPEDHGDVRQRRDLEPARVVHAGRDRRQGRHSAAGQRCAATSSPA